MFLTLEMATVEILKCHDLFNSNINTLHPGRRKRPRSKVLDRAHCSCLTQYGPVQYRHYNVLYDEIEVDF